MVTASVIIEAARAEEAFPPRSRVPAITGAASGVQIVVARHVQAAHQQAFALDFGEPERRPCLACP